MRLKPITYLLLILCIYLIGCASHRVNTLESTKYDQQKNQTEYLLFPFGSVILPGKWEKTRYNTVSLQQFFTNQDSVELSIALNDYTKFEFNQDGSKKGFDFLNAYYEWETNYRKSLNGLNSRIIESDKQKNYMIFQLFGQNKENNINVFYLIKMPKNILNTISISSAKWDDDKKISFLRGLNQ